MNLSRKQRTLARPTAIDGIGYWSGQPIRVEFRPAPADTGHVFFRADSGPLARIPVQVEHRVEMPRRTTLAASGARVEMVEHLLAALSGLQIDNCEVHVNATEMPGLDGSCLPVVQALKQAGTCEQDADRLSITIRDITRVGDEDGWVEIRPQAGQGLKVHYHLDYGRDNPIGRQKLEIDVTRETFEEQIAPARTFLLQREAEWLRQQGIGERVTLQDLLVFDDEGPMDNQLRFDDECVRHKILDLVGDFALAGCDINGYVTAYKSGHRLNAELVQVILKEYAAELLNRTPSAPRKTG